MQRRLAAILAADIAGYSRLVDADEVGTVQRLTALSEHLIAPLVAEHHGRVVKMMGDGFLVEFASLVDAVRCAVAWQAAVARHEADRPEAERFSFRIGVNLGDVIVEDDDIYGGGVNIAARLEGIAKPGGTCLSTDAYRQVRRKVATKFQDMGEWTLKNLSEPLRVYCAMAEPPGETASGAAISAAGPQRASDKPSIAVLPFVNMSRSPDHEHFADGMTDDIITALSKFHWFFVIARSSTFTYKAKTVKIQQIARELGVRYVLEGSIQCARRRLRVNAQLVDALSAGHIWAERYDRELGELFALQDEITEAIATAIEPEIGAVERERARRKPPNSLDVWALYQQGLWHF